jgi:hypothetical protein
MIPETSGGGSSCGEEIGKDIGVSQRKLVSVMPRSSRASAGGFCYQSINCGNARSEVFHKQEDFDAFLRIMSEASIRLAVRIIAHFRIGTATFILRQIRQRLQG